MPKTKRPRGPSIPKMPAGTGLRGRKLPRARTRTRPSPTRSRKPREDLLGPLGFRRARRK